MAEKLKEFPIGSRITKEEREAWLICRELRPLLDRVCELAMELWRTTPKDELTTSAVGNLTIAGMSIQGEVVVFGDTVMLRIKPYWYRRQLISDAEFEAIQGLGSNELTDLVRLALTLDSRIRARLNLD